jgi:hypothetical protein
MHVPQVYQLPTDNKRSFALQGTVGFLKLREDMEAGGYARLRREESFALWYS